MVARKAEHKDPSQKWKYNTNKNAAHNWNPFSSDKLTMDIGQGDRDGSIVHMWTYHNGWNQRFDADYKVEKPVIKSTGLKPNKPFMIVS